MVFFLDYYNSKLGLLLGNVDNVRIVRMRTLEGVLNKINKIDRRVDSVKIFKGYDMHSTLKLVATFKVVNGKIIR